MKVGDAMYIQDEITLGIEMTLFAIDYTRARISTKSHQVEDIEANTRSQLAIKLEKVIQSYENVWMKRNRIGGLSDSVARMIKILNTLKA